MSVSSLAVGSFISVSNLNLFYLLSHSFTVRYQFIASWFSQKFIIMYFWQPYEIRPIIVIQVTWRFAFQQCVLILQILVSSRRVLHRCAVMGKS